jgi:purine-cytosine permease-like protein
MPPTSPASPPVAEEAPQPRNRPRLSRRPPSGITARLVAQLSDDYSTEKSKPVPVSARVPRWHLTALWITLLGGAPAMAVGVDYYLTGYSLVRALAAVAVGGCCYLAYAVPAAYLGARTGRGTALLTRAVFGSAASAVITDLLVAVGAARLAFGSTVVASLYASLLGWHNVAVVAAGLAVLSAAVNVFGFVGMAAVARYLAAPLLLAWAVYLVSRGIATGHVSLSGPSQPETLPFLAGVGIAIGAIGWGNEPDIWRYGKAELRWSIAPYVTALAAGSLLPAAVGWLMASASRGGTRAAFVHGVRFSTFGVLGLAAVVIAVLQVASGTGACYLMTNAVQSLVGRLRGWRRWHTALLVAALGGLTTWAIQGSVTGFARVAAWSAVVLPSVTVVMCVELLVLRRSEADRSGRRVKIPPWGGWRRANWGAIAAVLVASGYGGWAMALLPGQHAAHPPWSVPVESWLLAGGIYAAVGAGQAGYTALRSVVARARHAVRQAAAKRAEAKRQAAAKRAEAKQQAAASRAEAKRQAAASRAEARRQARTKRAAKRAAAKRAAAKRRPGRPAKLSAVPVRAPRPPRPRDYLEAIRRDIADIAAGNPYLDLLAAGEVPRERLGDFAAEQAELSASDRRSFRYLSARSEDQAGSLFAEFADAEGRALDLLAIFTSAIGREGDSAVGPPRPGCRAYPAFVAWLALNADPVDAAVALVACRPTWNASLAGMGRALRERPRYRFGDRACAFFELVAAPDSHAEDQLVKLMQRKIDAGQPPARATGYAQLLASYQATFWSTLAAEATEMVSSTGE